MVLLVAMDGDVVKAGGGEVGAEFVGGVGMHTIDNLLPLLVGIGEAVILIYNDEATTFFQCATYSSKALLYLCLLRFLGLKNSKHIRIFLSLLVIPHKHN